MKPYCVISAPLDTQSGYGHRSRSFIKALYELKNHEWDIQLLSQRWGQTSQGFIADNAKEWGWMDPLIIKNQQIPKQPDYFFMISIPNEANAIGKTFNVMVTAGIETDMCAPSWIDGINRMDLTLVSSEHAKKVFEASTFREQNQVGQVIRDIKLQKKVEVLQEEIDTTKYFFIDDQQEISDMEETDLVSALDEIQEDFCYLFVGHWLQGDLGEDRKNVGLTVYTFLDTFKNKKKKPALVLKTSGGATSILDRDQILEKIDSIRKSFDPTDELPNIYLLHGEVDDKDMNYLYNHNKIKAMISLTKGEGFGRPLLEFTVAKKPLIVSYWSGQTDFLDMDYIVPVLGELRPIHPSAQVKDILIPESKWFYPNEKQVKQVMTDVFENYQKYIPFAKRQAHKSITEYSFEKLKEKLKVYLDSFPQTQQLQLPKLKKISVPTLK